MSWRSAPSRFYAWKLPCTIKSLIIEKRPHSSFASDLARNHARWRQGEAAYQIDSILASYLHWYFPSSPQQIARWLRGEFG
jgi:cobyrinic acid a,c-diamide synthase